MFGFGRRPAVPARRRLLRLEPLEDRNLLAASDVVGTVIHDRFGNLFTVDIRDGMAVEYLGTADTAFFDIAFSPDGELYGVTGPSTTVSQLRRIDVDLADPTPTVTIDTELIGLVETAPGESLKLNSLEFRPDGVLFGAGENEDGGTFVYSISTDSASATEEISLGDFDPAGDIAFAEDGNLYVTTKDPLPLDEYPQLLEIDAALSTVTPVGSVVHDDFFGLTYGPGPEMYGFRREREVYSINRDDASVTFVETLTHPELDGRFIQGAANIYAPPDDLGTLDFAALSGQEPVAGELWYYFEPVRDGYLTAEIVGADPGADIDLSLHTLRSDGTLRQRDSGRLRFDYESAEAGQVYYLQVEGADAAVDLRIANLLQIVGNGALIHGTDGDDLFEFTRGTSYAFSINGVAYEFGFNPASAVDLTFEGGPGEDDAVLVGSTKTETVTLDMAARTAEGVGFKYRFHVTGAENIRFEGGAGEPDSATLIGTAAKDVLTLHPDAAELVRTGSLLEVVGVESIDALTGGGGDVVEIEGSSSEALTEYVTASPTVIEYTATGFSHHVEQFQTLNAHSNGGIDVAFLYDSPEVDQFTVDGSEASLARTGGFELNTFDFHTVHAYSVAGGRDVAVMNGTDGDDVLLFYKGMTKLYDDGMAYYRRAKHFEEITVSSGAANSGNDVAYLIDSKEHDEFTGGPAQSTMQLNVVAGPGGPVADVEITAIGFFVHAYSRYGGGDIASLHDSAGDDEVHAKPDQVKIYNVDDPPLPFYVRAKGFPEVYAYADTAGHDRAVFNDSGGADIFTGTPTYSEMRNTASTYINGVFSFEVVVALATPGTLDSASLFDTPFKDSLNADLAKADPWHWAELGSDSPAADYLYYIRGFDSADAWSSNVEDEATVDPATADWLVLHGW